MIIYMESIIRTVMHPDYDAETNSYLELFSHVSNLKKIYLYQVIYEKNIL